MALRNVINSRTTGPYGALPPPLHVRVIAEKESPKVLAWEFSGNPVKPKTVKKNKTVAITDGHSCTSLTLLEDLTEKLRASQNYIIKGYKLRGTGPPYKILVSKETAIYRSSPLEINEDLIEEGKKLLWPTSKATHLNNVKDGMDLVTVEGQIVEVSKLDKPIAHFKFSLGVQLIVCCYSGQNVIFQKQSNNKNILHMNSF